MRKYNIEADEDISTLASDYFGLTDDFRFGGFILKNGTVLNFKKYGDEEEGRMDHNVIEYIGVDKDKFIALGNIRINECGMDIAVKPTYEQQVTISNFVRTFSDKCFYIDIRNNEGYLICGKVYENPDNQRIIADILRYFDDGIKLI